MSTTQTFRADTVWQSLLALLVNGLDTNDIAPVSERDFENDSLVMNPPSVRIFFAGVSFESTSDSQRLSYESVGRFVVLCGDQDVSSEANQAMASLCLACEVIDILAGARVLLPSGEQSEPITLVSCEPMLAKGLGTVYGVGIEVPGLAQYLGVNAYAEAI